MLVTRLKATYCIPARNVPLQLTAQDWRVIPCVLCTVHAQASRRGYWCRVILMFWNVNCSVVGVIWTQVGGSCWGGGESRLLLTPT